jgi:uncharacterized repeat protein (TIGR03803 family)
VKKLWLALAISGVSILAGCGGEPSPPPAPPKHSTCTPGSSAIYPGTQVVTYTFRILHSFTGRNVPAMPEGGHPYAGLAMDGSGDLYGTTISDGANGYGTVFKVDPTGKETTLHDFANAADGAFPWSQLVQDDKCNLYGTAGFGGTGGYGTVFKLDPSGNFTVLYSFGGADGNSPRGGLVLNSSGNIYGTTQYGGASGLGVVFKLAANGVYSVLYSFKGGTDGAAPAGTLLRDAMGNLWGVTVDGGAAGSGTIYKIDSAGNESVVHTFTGPDGAIPLAGLVEDSAGNLYGTAVAGGTQQVGVIYKITTSGNFTILYNFPGGAAGEAPYSVVRDGAGNFYGVAAGGGDLVACPVSFGCGLVFKVEAGGNETVLHTFTGIDGAFGTELIQDSAGNLYGTTTDGGVVGCNSNFGNFVECGVAFKLTAH